MVQTWRHQICLTALIAAAAGCGGFGRVNQGQVIEYDRERGLIRIIQDSNYQDPANPRYDILPPIEVRIPADPREMGPEPEAGKLLRLDHEKRQAVIYDEAAQALRIAPYSMVAEQGGIDPADSRAVRARRPLVDRAAGTITVYDARQSRLLTFAVAPEHLALSEDAWRPGDQVRYYYKEPGRALRLMNVSKTDLNSK
jgi:hypothetical protein